MGVTFLLLGATAGAAMNLVGVSRSLLYYYAQDKARSKLIPLAIVTIAVIVTVLTWHNILSLLPMSAMILAAIAFWQQQEQKIRIMLLLAAPLWMIYNFNFHSYAGLASASIAIVSLLVALYRYRGQPISVPQVA